MALAFGTLACTSAPPPADTITAVDVLAARAAKDAAFRSGPDSPLPRDGRDEWLPLSYFPVDPAYRASAALRVADAPHPVVEMPTSTGKIRSMSRVGVLEFTLKGHPLRLTAFMEAGAPPDRLFVPFTDLTSGTETYAAGRYLDLDQTATGLYEIDFNLAYHPYCYYNVAYDCPYPPPENRLPIPIRAGERLPSERAETTASDPIVAGEAP